MQNLISDIASVEAPQSRASNAAVSGKKGPSEDGASFGKVYEEYKGDTGSAVKQGDATASKGETQALEDRHAKEFSTDDTVNENGKALPENLANGSHNLGEEGTGLPPGVLSGESDTYMGHDPEAQVIAASLDPSHSIGNELSGSSALQVASRAQTDSEVNAQHSTEEIQLLNDAQAAEGSLLGTASVQKDPSINGATVNNAAALTGKTPTGATSNDSAKLKSGVIDTQLNSINSSDVDNRLTNSDSSKSASGLNGATISGSQLWVDKGVANAQVGELSTNLSKESINIDDFDGLAADLDIELSIKMQSNTKSDAVSRSLSSLIDFSQAVEPVISSKVDVTAPNLTDGLNRGSSALLSTSSTSLSSYTTAIGVPYGSEDWTEDFAQKVVWLSGREIKSAEIHINPPELGPVEVKISVQNDQTSVNFNAQHSSVRELLESNVHRLREMFNANGVELADVNVGSNSDQSAQDQGDDASSAGFAGFNGGEASSAAGAAESESVVRIESRGLVDFYA